MASRIHLTPRLLATILLSSLGLVVLARAQGPAAPGPGGASAAALRSELRAFSGSAGQWAWIKDQGAESELYVGRPGEAGRIRAKGAGWTEVAQDGADIWLLARAERGGVLLRLPREGNALPTEVTRIEDQSGALLAQGGQAFWLELSQAADPGLAFVPPLGARIRLRCREANGRVRTLLDRPAAEGAAPGAGDLVALANGQLYLRLRSTTGTELLSVRPSDGTLSWIAGESGTQEALLDHDRLVWTAPSAEATPESGIRCVHRFTPGGAPELVAEWLPPNSSLVVTKEGLGVLDRDDLYRLPSRLGPPTFLRKVTSGRIVSDSRSLVLLSGEQPQLLPAGSPRP